MLDQFRLDNKTSLVTIINLASLMSETVREDNAPYAASAPSVPAHGKNRLYRQIIKAKAPLPTGWVSYRKVKCSRLMSLR
jgi:hypothetical protein